MAQPGVRKHETLQFSNSEEVSILKKQGNFKKTRVCNGKIEQVLAEELGVLAVQCRRNNGGQVRPPTGDIIYTVIAEIPKRKSGGDSGNQNGGINILVEVYSDPNITVSETATSTFVGVNNAGIDTGINIFT